MSNTITRGVRVQVEPFYIADRSDPANAYWFFAYRVRIANEGEQAVQLISRHWVITDANGEEQHVRGPGVIGEQPVLEPGEDHGYTSACPLRTSMGTMHGSYQMRLPDGEMFDAKIDPFMLADPLSVN